MTIKEKHCDKCSYEDEEGLHITGCNYCGCHNRDNEIRAESKLQQIIKEEEEEFDETFDLGYGGGIIIHNAVKDFIKSHNAKIIKAVCEEMVGKKKSPFERYGNGYNARVQEEIEKAKELKCNHQFAHKKLDKDVKKISADATLSVQCEYCGMWLSDKGQKVSSPVIKLNLLK